MGILICYPSSCSKQASIQLGYLKTPRDETPAVDEDSPPAGCSAAVFDGRSDGARVDREAIADRTEVSNICDMDMIFSSSGAHIEYR